jgi:hypothetical protein
MLGGEVRRDAVGLVVDDEVDFALPVERDVLRAVRCDPREAEHLEHRLEHVGRRGGEFDEFESHEPHRIFEQISHVGSPECAR